MEIEIYFKCVYENQGEEKSLQVSVWTRGDPFYISEFFTKHEYFKGPSQKQEAGCIDRIVSPRMEEAEYKINLLLIAFSQHETGT
jgi:hypothetical protein